LPISFLDIPPYDIYFADFGYPIGVLERKVTNPQSQLSISPNPFSKLTEIKIQTQDVRNNLSTSLGTGTQDILLKIYDVSGRIVKVFNLTSPVSLREAERADLLLPVSAVSWDGTNDKGIKLPAGIYFCVVYTDQGNIVEKVVKLK
jgi:hypothetical protein